MTQLTAPRSTRSVTATPALLGGPPAVAREDPSLFDWPIITAQDEQAVLRILRKGAMSGLDETDRFEREFAHWQGVEHAVGFNNGTAAIQAAMFACGLKRGDELIAPSVTFWATVGPCLLLGATPVFAEIDPQTLCLDADDIEHRITDRTRAIVVVHNYGHPADMDAILAIARRHGLKVIEDVSHAQGGRYKGRKLGAIGDVGAMSLMSQKSLAAGEAGMLVTADQEIRDRAIAFAHHARFDAKIATEYLRPFAGLPMGGVKGRMHQISAAMGRVQLRQYDARCAEIRAAMDYFWQLLEDVPGLRPHRVGRSTLERAPCDDESNMAGWYSPKWHYDAAALGGLSVTGFAKAVTAEGSICNPGCNRPLHLHPLFGANPPSLPVSEAVGARVFSSPWFKHHRPELIEQHAAAYRKVAQNYETLLAHDPGDSDQIGSWMLSAI